MAPLSGARARRSARELPEGGDEVAVGAGHGEDEGLSGLGGEGGDVRGSEEALGGPEGLASRARRRRRGRVRSRRRRGRRPWWRRSELGEEELLDGPRGEERGDVVGVGLEVAGEVGVVGDEDGLSGEGAAGVLEVEDLLDGVLGLGEGGGGDASEGEVGEEVVAVDGGVGGGRRRSRGRRTG